MGSETALDLLVLLGGWGHGEGKLEATTWPGKVRFPLGSHSADKSHQNMVERVGTKKKDSFLGETYS